jgi:hypothetical protein
MSKLAWVLNIGFIVNEKMSLLALYFILVVIDDTIS